MSRPSLQTLRVFADELAGSWILRAIEDLFEEEHIGLGPPEAAENVSGQRRAMMAQYVSSLDLDRGDDVRRLYRVFNRVLADVDERGPDAAAWLLKLETALRRDGITVDAATHQIVTVGARLSEQALSALSDATAIREHLTRLDATVDRDPRLAVSVAKDLVESAAKLILRDREVPYAATEDLPALVGRAQEALGLSAGKVPSDNPDSKQLKTILGGLGSLTKGLAELRNQVGVGHGRENVPTWVRPRHARLAAGAAQVWCQLMLETLDDPEAPWRSSPPAAVTARGPASRHHGEPPAGRG